MKNIYYLLFLLLPFVANSQTEWKIAKSNKGIQIQVRKTGNSPYKEYKAITSINTSLDQVLRELLEAPEYMENCKEGISHLVKINKHGDYIFYAKNEFSWPVKDRDVVSRIRIERISKTVIKLNIDAVPEEVPRLKNTLRIQEMSGFWLLEEKNGRVAVTQQLYINPEGSLPPFITNSLLVTGPFKTFLELRNKLEKANS
ncbi:START domain-containing protein [Aquimarina aggregata]|uniref:START domain-containing protein n=1 Tax=Aquimarina aggregata TaxID=1642818 RepID=UPI002490B217|nr:START domain-containing protein [Aquimarina aggregata]